MSSVQMAERPDRSRGGRPSKGDRADLMVRVPSPLRERFARDASGRGLSQSDLMAQILAMLYPSAEEGGMPNSA
jgi:hypothetical protein